VLQIFMRLDAAEKLLLEFVARKVVPAFSASIIQNITNGAWGSGPVGFRNKIVSDALFGTDFLSEPELIPQETTNLAWPCAKISSLGERFHDTSWFVVLAIAVEFITQDCSNST